MIERDEYTNIHKNNVIRALKQHPENLAEICSGFATAAEAIAYLESRPEQWFVNGRLEFAPKHSAPAGREVTIPASPSPGA